MDEDRADPASEGSTRSDERLIDAAWRQVEDVSEPGEPQAFVLEGYRVLRRLHRGGQGVVYQAIEEATGRKVAIKVQRGGPLDDSTAAERFEREVRVLGAIDHPNVVRVHQSGSVRGGAYYVMDYVAGRPLDAYLAGEAPSTRETVQLFRGICEAVSAAHLRGVIHRDLKPANILIDETGRPRVLDFGLAKLVAGLPSEAGRPPMDQGHMTLTGQFLGSLPWASPEQVGGNPHDVDVRSDVYSLGVILYQMLADCFPYPVVGSPREVMWNIAHAETRPLDTVRPRIDDELQTIVRRCLAKEPERRYQSAGELERDLARHLAGEPIEARRDSTAYLVRKTLRRHPVLSAVAGLAVLVTALAIVFLTVANRRENELRTAAERQARIARAISEFLNEDLLAAVRPDAQGREVSMRTVLDTAAARIEGRFLDEPAVEAELRETLGETYMHLGAWEEAERHLRRALDLHRVELGDEDPGTLVVLDLLARILRRLTRYDESLELHDEMVATARRTLGDEHELTLRGLSNTAIVLGRLGRYEQAEELNRPVLEARLRTLGEEHVDTLTSMNNQANYVYRQLRFDESRALNERVLAIRRRVLGNEDPETLLSMNNLAIEYGSVGLLGEQEALLLEALETGARVLGPDHPDLLPWRLNLGACYRSQGRLDDAHAVLLESLELSRLRPGETNARVGIAMIELAQVELARRRFAEAEQYCLDARPILALHLEPNHMDRESVELLLTDVYRETRRFDQAEAILLERHGRLRTDLGPDHVRTRDAEDRLAGLYEAWGFPERAKAYLGARE